MGALSKDIVLRGAVEQDQMEEMPSKEVKRGKVQSRGGYILRVD